MLVVGNSATIQEEFIEMTNCFTFNPIKGFVDGIELVVGAPRLDNRGTYPPHVRVGGEFIAADSVKHPVAKNGQLVEASFRRITTDRNTFDVLSEKNDDSCIVLVDINLPKGVTSKINPGIINAWVTFESELATISLEHKASGRCLVQFLEGEDLMIYSKDGAVYHIVCRYGKMESIKLTAEEMARERVLLAERQLDENESGLSKQHAILGGIVRLLDFTRDTEAQEVLMDFLCDFSGENDMPTRMRQQTENLFRRYNDSRHIMFSAGEMNFDNVVPITAKQGLAEVKRKKAERAERDRELRAQMRGASNGGKQQQSSKNKRG